MSMPPLPPVVVAAAAAEHTALPRMLRKRGVHDCSGLPCVPAAVVAVAEAGLVQADVVLGVHRVIRPDARPQGQPT